MIYLLWDVQMVPHICIQKLVSSNDGNEPDAVALLLYRPRLFYTTTRTVKRFCSYTSSQNIITNEGHICPSPDCSAVEEHDYVDHLHATPNLIIIFFCVQHHNIMIIMGKKYTRSYPLYPTTYIEP